MYMETTSLRTLKIMPRNFNEIVRSWIRLQGLWRRDIVSHNAMKCVQERENANTCEKFIQKISAHLSDRIATQT